MSPDQPIPWKTRADLLSVEQDVSTAASCTVKDPVKDDYYFFSQVEFFFLDQLRFPQTFDSLIRRASQDLGKRIGIAEIQNFLRLLARDNLIVPLRLGDGERLFRLHRLETRASWKQQILGLLSIKLPGFHPGGLLTPFKPLGWLLFNPVSVVVLILLVSATLLFALFSVDSLLAQVPAFSQLATAEHVLAVLVGFVLAKILHELGHAIACQYTGHECSEMGILLLVFLPCLYCDVSDMWREKSRSKRILVSMAGVYVELSIALLCFWIWFLTVPGGLHNFCYSLMLVTSVNTLFINGNPLMRYDGYFALADLIRTPNLGQVSRQQLANRFRQFFLRQDAVHQQRQSGSFLLMYAACAAVYRWLILGVISFGIWKVFDYQQLRSIGNLVVAFILIVAIVPILINLRSSLSNVAKFGIRWTNTAVTVAILSGFVYLIFNVEFSHRIWGRAEVQLADPEYVFAPADGRFETQIEDGQIVSQGDIIGRIENPQLELQTVILESQVHDAEMNLRLISLKTDSHQQAGKLEFWKKRESTLNRQLAENRNKLRQLIVQSPTSGQIVAFQHPGFDEESDALPRKTGTLFENQNRDGQLSRGDPICYVAQPNRLSGFIAVEQKDIELVDEGQPVKIAIPFQEQPLLGNVVAISLEEDKRDPAMRSNAGETTNVTYRVEVEFPANSAIRVGSLHHAVIIGGRTDVAKFVARWLRNSFWF